MQASNGAAYALGMLLGGRVTQEAIDDAQATFQP